VIVATVGAAFLVWALARPEHAALGVIAVLPFLVYPATVGKFSLFAAAPLVGIVSVTMLLAQRGSVARLRWRLSAPAFGLLFLAAAVAALHSSNLSTAASRLVYLALFGLFAWALAASITAGRLKPRTLAIAIVLSAALASVALIVQVVMQFAVGQGTVANWLSGEFGLFGGAKGAAIATQQSNWVVGSLNIVRGIFPFMAAPSAGQYTMLGFVAAIWMWRERGSEANTTRTAVIALAMIVIGAGLLATFSRQSWVGAFAGVGALMLRRNALKPVLVIGLLFVVLAVTPVPGAHSTFGDYLLTASNTSTTSSATRLGLLSQAIHLVPHHALIGVGPGLYETLNPDPSNPVYYAHNVWLDATVELGVLGGLALIAVFVLAMRSAFRRSATLGFGLLAAYAVANLFDDALYFPRNGILLATAFALAASYGPAARTRSPSL
jgi:O-antigen ligase